MTDVLLQNSYSGKIAVLHNEDGSAEFRMRADLRPPCRRLASRLASDKL